jgi:two-component system CheB/CheR fusion protein
VKSKNHKKPSGRDANNKKASESKSKKRSVFSRPIPAGRTQKSGDYPNHFPIVGIGASAGGLEAFTELLSHLPLDTGMGFVLVQHLDPQHESALTQLLTG